MEECKDVKIAMSFTNIFYIDFDLIWARACFLFRALAFLLRSFSDKACIEFASCIRTKHKTLRKKLAGIIS